MVTIKLAGGLGNQFFEYAFGRYIAEEYHKTLFIDNVTGYISDFWAAEEKLSNFNVKGEFLNPKKWLEEKSDKVKIIEETMEGKFKIIPGIQQMTEKFSDIYYCGTWQNEKYFKGIKKQLQEELVLKQALDGKNKEIETAIRDSESVCVHFRLCHGRSWEDNKIHEDVHNLYGRSSREYYLNAIADITKKYPKIELFVFSDAPDIVKDVFETELPVTFVDCNDSLNVHKDFELMRQCKHHISTLSWWAAWLNDNPHKMIFAPSIWMQTDQFDFSELYPQDWKVI
jgi:hypothetical protein